MAQGGYPGFVLTLPSSRHNDVTAISTIRRLATLSAAINSGQLAGLIDIAQEKNYQFIRHPVAAGEPEQHPGGHDLQQA